MENRYLDEYQHAPVASWSLYQIVSQNMLRTLYQIVSQNMLRTLMYQIVSQNMLRTLMENMSFRREQETYLWLLSI